ncbi:hypothetical protein [Bacillus timonensis]|nr:hypothetical protein [Bacillus timonensis]
MGCCGPEYRKVVEDQEKKVNQNPKETFPIWGKIVSVAIIVSATIAFILL